MSGRIDGMRGANAERSSLARHLAKRAAAKEPLNWVVPVLIVYLWFLVATPYNRFPIFTDLRFERILVAVGWLAGIAGAFLVPKMSRINWASVLLWGWMWLSWLSCDVWQFVYVRNWVEDYWKLMVFQFLFLFAISRRRDVRMLFFAFGTICGLYQLHSMWDFAHGGAYVYQQGIKRMIGVWAEKGGGAGNAYAVLALVTLPFAEFGYRLAERLWVRRMYLGFAVLSMVSIVFSGTRAALVCAAVFVVLHLRSTRAIFGAVAIVLILGVVVLPLLPDNLAHRYIATFGGEDESDESSVDTKARLSGESRIAGLRDGYILATQRPILGYGPGSSMWVRFRINPTPFGDGRPMMLQLHNLYGQVMSEVGFVGAGIFALMVAFGFGSLRRIRRMAERLPDAVRRSELLQMAATVRYSLILMLCYGMFAHTLYDYEWLLMSAFIGSLEYIARVEARATEPVGRRAVPSERRRVASNPV